MGRFFFDFIYAMNNVPKRLYCVRPSLGYFRLSIPTQRVCLSYFTFRLIARVCVNFHVSRLIRKCIGIYLIRGIGNFLVSAFVSV